MDSQPISVSQPKNLLATSLGFESSFQISAIMHFLHLFSEQRWISVLETKYIFNFSLRKDRNSISTIWTSALCICILFRYSLQRQMAKIQLWCMLQTVTGILIQESFEVKKSCIRPSLCFA